MHFIFCALVLIEICDGLLADESDVMCRQDFVREQVIQLRPVRLRAVEVAETRLFSENHVENLLGLQWSTLALQEIDRRAP